MVCFLALVLESVLLSKLRQQDPDGSYDDLLSDLAPLHVVAVEIDGETSLTRTKLVGQAYEARRSGAAGADAAEAMSRHNPRRVV